MKCKSYTYRQQNSCLHKFYCKIYELVLLHLLTVVNCYKEANVISLPREATKDATNGQ